MKVFRFSSCFLLALAFPTAVLAQPFAPGNAQRDQLFGDGYVHEKILFPKIPPLEFSDISTNQNDPVAGSYFGDNFPFSKGD